MAVDLCQLTLDTAHPRMSLANPCHTNLVFINRTVGLTPGWDRLWMVSKTCLRIAAGASGLGFSAETSHNKVRRPASIRICSQRRPVIDVRYTHVSGSSRCWSAMALKSTPFRTSPTAARDNASETVLSAPATCWISVVYWEMYSSCRSCLVDHGSET